LNLKITHAFCFYICAKSLKAQWNQSYWKFPILLFLLLLLHLFILIYLLLLLHPSFLSKLLAHIHIIMWNNDTFSWLELSPLFGCNVTLTLKIIHVNEIIFWIWFEIWNVKFYYKYLLLLLLYHLQDCMKLCAFVGQCAIIWRN
jgi:hypothetical protein